MNDTTAQAPAAKTSPLVTGDWLAAHLDDPAVRVIEVSSDPERAAYLAGHVPGAAGVFWKSFCWHETDRQFITPEEMAARLGVLGAGPETTVVLYGDPVQYGTYAFWTLTMAGHTRLRLLDGSRTRWLADGRPLAEGELGPAPVAYRPGPGDPSSRVGREDVRAHLQDPGRVLVDFRSPEEYRGERVMELGQFDHGAERKGRIPGARHLYFRELLRADDTFKSAGELSAVLAGIGIRPEMPEEIVGYCRLSHRATLGWFAMRYLLGMRNVRIYDGSWTEWGSIVGFPVEN